MMDSDLNAAKESRKMKKRRQDALFQFRKGLDLYEQGWNVELKKDIKAKEENCPSKKATIKFSNSVRKFEKSYNFHSNDPEIIRYYKLAVRKVRGNEKFEKALTCQRQAGVSEYERDYRFAILRYQDAIDDYTAARKHFEKGGLQDLRFDNYLDIVVEGLQTVITRKIRLITLTKAEDPRQTSKSLPILPSQLDFENSIQTINSNSFEK